ncbi:MAG: DUF5329 family protein [Pseudomonadota bacterium]
MRRVVVALLLALLASAPTVASDDDATIEALLVAVGESACTFIRNGKEYSSTDAEDHLRMKYRRGKQWATDAETFIERIASKSSFSGKPYRIRCGNGAAELTSDWLAARLTEIESR